MKQLIIALLAITTFTCTSVNAQHKHPFAKHPQTKYEKLRQQLRFPMTKSKYAAKTTATDARLISQTGMEHDGTAFQLVDSFTYSYSGSRGGRFDDIWLSWAWDADQGYYYEHNGTTYDPASMKLVMAYNTSGQPDNYIVQEWSGSTWDNIYKVAYTYDGSGNMITSTDYDWGGSAWDNSYKRTYTYTTTNRIATELEQSWNTSTSTWDNSTRNTNTWNTSDQLTGVLLEFWTGTAWSNGLKFAHTYDGSGNRTESLREDWNSSTSAWEPSYKGLYTGFTAHQPHQSTDLVWNSSSSSYENSGRTNYTYNSYGKPVYEFSETWMPATTTWAIDTYDYAYRYHYETYTTAGVDHIAPANGTVAVYPVPAAATINIDVNWTEAQRYAATVTDATGRMYMTWTSPAMAKTHHETVEVDNLPPGNYILTLQGDKGRVVKQFTVLR